MMMHFGCTGIEVACNLLDVARSPKEAVLKAVQELADMEGVSLAEAYTTGQDPERICELAEAALTGS